MYKTVAYFIASHRIYVKHAIFIELLVVLFDCLCRWLRTKDTDIKILRYCNWNRNRNSGQL